MPCKTIILVEDDPAIAEPLCYALAREGWRVLWHSTGHAALAALAKESVDFMILDVGLPDMDGKQLATKVRELRPALPILFASGYADNIDVPAGMQVIAKPFSIDQLRDKVKSMLPTA